MPSDRRSQPFAAAAAATGAYRVTVYGEDATQLREYAMDSQLEPIRGLDDAVACLRRKLGWTGGPPAIAIVTEETLNGFNQVQITL